MHTTHSDGDFSPERLVDECASLGLQTVGIADHDTTNHILQAKEAGEKHGIKIVPATELSVTHGDQYFHLLVFMFNPEDEALRCRIEHFKNSREKEFQETSEALSRLGITFFPEDLTILNGNGTYKEQIALAALSREENDGILAQEGISNAYSFVKHYLAKGRPANIERKRISAEEAIAISQQAGGKTFLAHPMTTMRYNFKKIVSLIDKLYVLGLDGIEVFHTDHSRKQVLELQKIAKEYNLMESVGSDFHGPRLPGFQIGGWKNYGLKPNLNWLK